MQWKHDFYFLIRVLGGTLYCSLFLGSIKLDNCYILMIGARVSPFCGCSNKCSKFKMIGGSLDLDSIKLS